MATRTDAAEPGRKAVEQAAAWHAQLGDAAWDESDRQDLDAWLETDPAHRIAFERMARIGGRMAPADAVTRTALRAMYRAKAPRRAMVGILLAAGLAGGGWILADNPAIRTQMAAERTAHGQRASATLATQDRLTLDSDSALDIDNHRRTVRLWRGAVMATVHHGAPLPFVVRTPQGTAQALGTQFSVRVVEDATIVAVITSQVRACAALARPSCVTLGPGQAARLDAVGAHRLPAMDARAEQGWPEGLLVADDLPLSRVLDQLNRYRAAPIRYDATDLQGLSLSGTFPLTDSAQALAGIGAALPVTVETGPDGTVVRRR
ncbi:FecR domain-containing protein [Sphingomonadaceae bacterium jetA1]|jgi:transmembrane sensor|uniref:FecR family protein n=1 Tax=Facivitalis istanbulensis TaxID=3075838 RepID=UPI003484DCE9